jgi:hypothetical protein
MKNNKKVRRRALIGGPGLRFGGLPGLPNLNASSKSIVRTQSPSSPRKVRFGG